MADAKRKGTTLNLYIGTMGWSYDFWKDSFYPEKLASKDFLAYYSKKFNTVEVDSTFYRIPSAKTIIEWKQRTPIGFRLSLKFPQKITHIKMLKDCQEETDVFLQRVGLLKEKLGVLLLQLPPKFKQKDFQLLADYLKALPYGYRYAVEVRSKSLLTHEVYNLLQGHNVALVWAEATKMPEISEITANFLYIRWGGNRKAVIGTLGKTEVDRSLETQQWAQKIRPLLERGQTVFGYFSKYYSGFPPSDVELFLASVEAVGK